MRWGFVGFGSAGIDPKRSTFNARAEGLQQSSLWNRPLHRQRCIVPVSGYYEWRKFGAGGITLGFVDTGSCGGLTLCWPWILIVPPRHSRSQLQGKTVHDPIEEWLAGAPHFLKRML